MARTVRKVSRASTKNQQKEKLSKKWWIVIASVIAAVVIGVTVGLIVYFVNQEEEAYVSDMVYFTEPVDVNGEEVKFIKENYQTLVRYLEAESVEHMLVFAYDGSQFFADPEDEDNYDEKYVTLITRLANLQAEVNAAKEAGVSIELYIVDVNVDSQVNADIMYDSEYFGGLYSSSSTTFEPAFFYNHEGEYKASVDFNDKTVVISTASLATILNSSINNAINYIGTLK